MRKIATAVLALPVLAALYVPVVTGRLRRSPRVVAAAGLGIVAIGFLVSHPPSMSPAGSLGPTVAPPVAAAASASNATVAGVRAPGPSAGAAVAEPPAVSGPADLSTVSTPRVRTAVVLGRGTIEATVRHGSVVDVRTAIELAFDRPVDAAAVAAATRIVPVVKGVFGAPDASTVVFRPQAPLAAGATYRVSLIGPLFAVDGSPIATPAAIAIRTAPAPRVVRFRPLAGARDVAVTATLSVRFTVPMDRATTSRAFAATANGTRISGRIRWAEGDTVLVLTPSTVLPAGATIRLSVAATARSAAGSGLAAAVIALARTVPARPPTATRAPASTTPAAPSSSAPWASVERYYLGLMNCTRTGGWVSSTGACTGAGRLATKPIILDAGLSARVSRPYARLLATSGACDHFINGTPTDRLHRAGYSGWLAENIGCLPAATPERSMIGTQIFFQNEKPCSGYCHYANLMNPAYTRCGIGVWIDHGRIRLVVDFYHP